MTLINKSLLQKRTQKLLTEKKGDRSTVSYQDAKKIGVLFTQSDRQKYLAIRNLVKQFKNDDKQVEVLCYLKKGGENYDFLYDYITKSDVGMWGKIQSQSAKKFASHNFDYVFYLDLQENLYLENVLAMCDTSCRIGFYKKGNDNLLDLMIEVNGNVSMEKAIEQIMYYTRKLGSDGR